MIDDPVQRAAEVIHGLRSRSDLTPSTVSDRTWARRILAASGLVKENERLRAALEDLLRDGEHEGRCQNPGQLPCIHTGACDSNEVDYSTSLGCHYSPYDSCEFHENEYRRRRDAARLVLSSPVSEETER